jgi:thymidylate kinase
MEQENLTHDLMQTDRMSRLTKQINGYNKRNKTVFADRCLPGTLTNVPVPHAPAAVGF